MDTVRSRLGGLPKKAGPEALHNWLSWGLAPLVDYTGEVFTVNDLALLSDAEYGDRIFEFLKIVTVRTKLCQKFADILDDDVEWQAVLRILFFIARELS